MSYQVGQVITFGLRVYDAAGVLADLGGGLPTATVTLPDGSTTTAAATKSVTGTYVATITGTALGRWTCVWSASGANSGGANGYTDQADVLDLSRLIVPLATARAALNLPATMTSSDDELLTYLAAATCVIERLIGPVLPNTRTVRLSGEGRDALLLPDLPGAVTAVTEDGTALDEGTGYCWDEAGIVWRGPRPHAGVWSRWTTRNVSITYTVGSAVIAPNVLLAAAQLVAHMWRTQTSTRPVMGATAPESTVVAGYLVPNRVVELLAGEDHRPPGIA